MIDQLTALARSLTISQRIGIVFGAAMSVLLVVGLVMWAGQPQMVPGFTGLDAQTAGQVSASLDSAGIPYELKGAGGIIMVPSNQLAEAKIAAADAGYTGSQAPGWDMFDSQSFGQTQEQQAIAEQRAVQGDLQNKIEGIQGVQEASVTIVPESQGTLVTQDNLASASVWVRMQGGQEPPADVVNGIVSMTASAVKGLVPANVTVVDSNGTTLAGPGTAESDAATLQNAVERQLEAKAEQFLYPVLGPNGSKVAVTADLDLDKVVKKITDYGVGNPSSAQEQVEVVGDAAAAGANGIPGTISNTAGLTYPNASPGASAAPSASPGSYLKTSRTVNWANTQTISDIIQTPGAIQRLSIAVMLNQTAIDNAKIPADTVKSLEAQVKAALGYTDTAERKDDFAMLPVAFYVPEAPAIPFDTSSVTSLIPTVLGVIIGAVLLVLVWRNMRSLKTRAEDMALIAARREYPALGAGDGAYAGIPGFQMAGIPELAAPPTPQSRAQEHIRLMADEKPDELASLVQTWLREDEKKRR